MIETIDKDANVLARLRPIQQAPAQEQVGASRLIVEPIAFVSPVIRINGETQMAVLVVRDTVSGEVKQQFPSERQIEAYRSNGFSGPVERSVSIPAEEEQRAAEAEPPPATSPKAEPEAKPKTV